MTEDFEFLADGGILLFGTAESGSAIIARALVKSATIFGAIALRA